MAARPAMGKTAFGLNIATNVALTSEKAVAVFSLEMGAEQLVTRMIASVEEVTSENETYFTSAFSLQGNMEPKK